ncbi:MAG: DeoR/GlpR family DNA-binding transcription regulator [Streptococcaceae bacterium]|jgi:DeoR/GlpR family transcriptional regulator of sugar metabolism|nr:DeoR/GlpR family DNA-binding transcription regulator [Streptococcaceae bacterium]
MLKKERQIYILKKVNRDGRAITNDLTEELGVAEDTIRKDFQELTAKGLVRRVHGGVLRIESSVLQYKERLISNTAVKEELVKEAVKLVADKHMLYIDGGTTNLKLAEALPAAFKGRIITNSPTTALIAATHLPNAEVNIIGGRLDPVSLVIKGASAVEQIQALNIECCILGVSSLTPENGITFPSSGEATLKKILVEHSNQVIVIANKEKLGSIATFFSCDISEIDYLITNEADLSITDQYQKKGVKVIVHETSDKNPQN